MADNLLPVNATNWEGAVENTSAARYPLDVDALRRARDPWLCPADILPWLAHQVGVDFWYDDWDEQTKRRAIAAMPRLKKLKGTLAGVRGYLDLIGVPVTYAKLPPQEGHFGDLSAQAYGDWLAQLPQLRLYPFRGAYETGEGQGFWDIELLFADDADAGTFFDFDEAAARTVERAYIWRNDIETELNLMAHSTRYEVGVKIDSVQVSLPMAVYSPALEDAALADVLFESGAVPAGHVISVELRSDKVLGNDVFDVAPAQFSLRALSTAYERVFEAILPGADEDFYDVDFVVHADGTGGSYFYADSAKDYIYRRAYLIDPAVQVPAADGDLLFDGHIWGLPPFTAIIGIDVSMPVPNPEMALTWGTQIYDEGYFDDPPLTHLDRAVEAVRRAQGGTDVIVIDTETFHQLKFGDAAKIDGTIKFGQMMNRIYL
jgi:phage tail P2-like protein